MAGPPVFHCLLELGQIHVGSFGDTVQPSRPLSSPSPLGFSLKPAQRIEELAEKRDELGSWLWNQRLGGRFLTVHPRRDNLCDLRQGAQSQDAPRIEW